MIINKFIVYPAVVAFGMGDVAAALPLYFATIKLLPTAHMGDDEKSHYTGLLITMGYLVFPIANLILILFPLMLFGDLHVPFNFIQHLEFIFSGFLLLS